MSDEPEIKSIPVGISPLGHCFVGRQLMLRERLTREQWNGYDQHADLICNSVLKRLPVEHPESTVWDNRRK
jgi:hypothetical protein